MEPKETLRRFKWKPSGTAGVKVLGHRRYVGGYWDEMGQLQFDFMRSQGPEPQHVLVDVACGSLRAGRFFIPYLEPGKYLGIDRERALINAGLEREVSADVVAEKQPELVADGSFSFERFSKSADFGIANSLFSHLTADDILLCLGNLRASSPTCVFFATFRPSDGRANPRRSTAHADMRYSVEEMVQLGEETGWTVEYVGDWGHPTGQHMMCFRPPAA